MAERRVLSTIVTETRWLTPSMVRIVLESPGFTDFEIGEFTDHYVKTSHGDTTRTYTVDLEDDATILATGTNSLGGNLNGSGSVTTFSRADGFATIGRHEEIVPAGAVIQASTSAGVVRITGIAFG